MKGKTLKTKCKENPDWILLNWKPFLRMVMHFLKRPEKKKEYTGLRIRLSLSLYSCLNDSFEHAPSSWIVFSYGLDSYPHSLYEMIANVYHSFPSGKSNSWISVTYGRRSCAESYLPWIPFRDVPSIKSWTCYYFLWNRFFGKNISNRIMIRKIVIAVEPLFFPISHKH